MCHFLYSLFFIFRKESIVIFKKIPLFSIIVAMISVIVSIVMNMIFVFQNIVFKLVIALGLLLIKMLNVGSMYKN